MFAVHARGERISGHFRQVCGHHRNVGDTNLHSKKWFVVITEKCCCYDASLLTCKVRGDVEGWYTVHTNCLGGSQEFWNFGLSETISGAFFMPSMIVSGPHSADTLLVE